MQPILAPGKSIYNEGVKIIAPYGSERQYTFQMLIFSLFWSLAYK